MLCFWGTVDRRPGFYSWLPWGSLPTRDVQTEVWTGTPWLLVKTKENGICLLVSIGRHLGLWVTGPGVVSLGGVVAASQRFLCEVGLFLWGLGRRYVCASQCWTISPKSCCEHLFAFFYRNMDLFLHNEYPEVKLLASMCGIYLGLVFKNHFVFFCLLI